MLTTLLTKPESKNTLNSFYLKIQPGGPGWKKIIDQAKDEGVELVTSKDKWSVPSGIIAMLWGCLLVYSCLFATGNWIYGETTYALILTGVAIGAAIGLLNVWRKMRKVML